MYTLMSFPFNRRLNLISGSKWSAFKVVFNEQCVWL